MPKKEKLNISKMSVDDLEKEVRFHNDLYFKKNQPVISDYDFDRMVERLRKLKPDSSLLRAGLRPGEGGQKS